MTKPRKILPLEMEAFIGDFRGLLEQIGSSGDVCFLQEFNSAPQVFDIPSLKKFLQNYSTAFLYPLELPAIYKAFSHAANYECRELIALDQLLSCDPRLSRFAAVSTLVGRTHLLNLRSLRENRFVQRYISALETGEAQAWHTLVYGVSLSLYSVPLRQGLLAYTTLVLDGFAHAAASRHRLSENEALAVVDEVSVQIPPQIDSLLGPGENLFKAA